jgi:hypothetical protein
MTDPTPTPDEANPTTRYDPPAPPSPTPPASPSSAPPAPPAPPASPATWRPTGGDPGRVGSIVMGGILLAVGLWFFADQTLGLEMPRLDWGDLWPLIIIAIGGWIVLTSLNRRG